MKEPIKLTTKISTPKSLLIILLVFILFFLFWLGLKYQEYILPKALKSKVLQPQISKSPSVKLTLKCDLYGFSRKEDFLSQYTVKKGDTLLLITKSQLGDVSRINELITLNKDKYPSLSIENPFLEQAWILSLPPKSFGLTTGQLFEFSGEITTIEKDGYWAISEPGSTVALFLDKNTKFIRKTTFNKGDCVKAIYETISLGSYKVLSVSPQ